MKKYIQISIFLGMFFLLVLGKNLHHDDENRVIGANQNTGTQNTGSSNTASGTGSTGNTNQSTGSTQQGQSSTTYKNGTYTGSSEDAFYGNIQVQVTVAGGKISDVQFLQYPNDNRTSQMINEQAMPMLKQEAIQAQSANVDIVSGASDSSAAFQKSLQNALQQAS